MEKSETTQKVFINDKSDEICISIHGTDFLISQMVPPEQQKLAIVNADFLLEVLLPAYADINSIDLHAYLRKAGKNISNAAGTRDLTPQSAKEIIYKEGILLECMIQANTLIEEKVLNDFEPK